MWGISRKISVGLIASTKAVLIWNLRGSPKSAPPPQASSSVFVHKATSGEHLENVCICLDMLCSFHRALLWLGKEGGRGANSHPVPHLFVLQLLSRQRARRGWVGVK